MKTIRLVVFAVAAIRLVVPSLRAQTSQGRILGRVTDQTGAVVPGATVTILNTETGIKRVLTANATGEYFAPNLDPGVYSITVEAPSFKKLQRPAFRLEVATDVKQDFVLRPGAATETVEVSGEQPLVETLNDTLGGTITNKAINELPLQGRDFQNLLELRPGVQRVPGGASIPRHRTGTAPTTITTSLTAPTTTTRTTVRPSSTTPEWKGRRPATCLWTQSRNLTTRRTREPTTDGSPEPWSTLD